MAVPTAVKAIPVPRTGAVSTPSEMCIANSLSPRLFFRVVLAHEEDHIYLRAASMEIFFGEDEKKSRNLMGYFRIPFSLRDFNSQIRLEFYTRFHPSVIYKCILKDAIPVTELHISARDLV